MIVGTPCFICGASLAYAFNATVLRRYDVKYYYCSTCGLTRTEDPFWLAEAYNDAIAMADTGLVQRNLSIADKLSVLLYFGFNPFGSYLDVAGGHGLLVRLMRDIGFNFFWDDKYCRNEFARGFEAHRGPRPFYALTAFEVLEHLPDPLDWLNKEMGRFGSKTLIFTTETYEGSRSPNTDWWYYSFNTGQHVTFYQTRTFQVLAERLCLKYQKLAGLHVLTNLHTRNRLMLKLLPDRLMGAMAQYVRKRMQSRTFDDHLVMLEQGCHTTSN